MTESLKSLLPTLRRIADMLGVLFFVAAFAGFIVQVFMRYVMNRPLAWTEEFVMVAFIWAVFWAAAFMVRIKEHVSFDVLYDFLPENGRRLSAIFAMVVLLLAFGLLIPHTVDYLAFLTRKNSPVLRLPMEWIYGCYLVFLVSFAGQGLHRLIGLMGRNWRHHL
jgi:TRAP-type C4-dicarboxylate transport system permease small subunit